jgi:hypothetical protein
MKFLKVAIVCAGITAVALVASLRYRDSRSTARETLPLFGVTTNKSSAEPLPRQPSPASHTNSFVKRAAELTAEEAEKLSIDFAKKYKPAVEKWFGAYADHIPFGREDFSPETFHSRVGDNMYTFMIGDTTLTVQDSKQGAKVAYLMTRMGALELNQSPGKGFVPELNVPINREEIIRMVKSDTGVEFKPNEVLIKPSGLACALNGGAFVEILPTGADPNNFLSSKISMVFGPDGKLINYERDPFF